MDSLLGFGFLAALGAGCASPDSFCVEQHVTVTQGIYGLVTYQYDVGMPPPVPVANEPIDVLDKAYGSPVAHATSDSHGVLQSPLDIGTYAVCVTDPGSPCVAFTISANELVRVDLHKGFGSYWQSETRSDCSN